LHAAERGRQGICTDRLALGRPEFVEHFRAELGSRGFYRELAITEGTTMLRGALCYLRANSTSEMAALSRDNPIYFTEFSS